MGAGKGNDKGVVRRKSSTKPRAQSKLDVDAEEEIQALLERNAVLEEQLREAEAEVDAARSRHQEELERAREPPGSPGRSVTSGGKKERRRSVAVSVPFTPKVTIVEPAESITPAPVSARERGVSSQDPHEVLRIAEQAPALVERRPSVEPRKAANSKKANGAAMGAALGLTPARSGADGDGAAPINISGAHIRVQSRINSTVRRQLADLLDRQQETAGENMRSVSFRVDPTSDHEGAYVSTRGSGSKTRASAKSKPAKRRSTAKSLGGVSRRNKSRPASTLTEALLELDPSSAEDTHQPTLSPVVNYDSIVDGLIPDDEEEDDEDNDDEDNEDEEESLESLSAKRSGRAGLDLALAHAHEVYHDQDTDDSEADDTWDSDGVSDRAPAPKFAARQPSSRMTSFMVNVSRLLTAVNRKALKSSEAKKPRPKRRQQEKGHLQLGNLIHYLPRGGVVIQTTIGPVQFGMPPETVKDSMAMGMEVPEIYVVTRERFNMSAGVNVCEIEFPAFFNFFIRKRKTILVTHRDAYEDLLTIMTEALNGPPRDFLFASKEYSDFASESVRAACPDHAKEVFHFRAPNRKPGTDIDIDDIHMLDIDMLLEFKFFDNYGVCDLGNGVMVYDDENNVRFELVDTKVQEQLAAQAGDDEEFFSDDAGVLIPYRVAESCTVPVSGGLVPRVDLSMAARDEVISAHADLGAKRVTPAPLGKSLSQDSLGLARKASARPSVASDTPSRVRAQRMGMLKVAGGSARSAGARQQSVVSATSAAAATLQEQQQQQQQQLDPAGVVSDESDAESFVIPKFGLTVLGNSHGFDEKGSTSGFVLWVNGQGVMVDPPPHSTSLLLEAGIPPNSITALILTHCHADHDAGTFQKMITEHKITLMTTTTIFESFKRKYAAVSGLKPEFIEQLVSFRPVFLEEPNYWNGASLRFFYSLHSIPCVGFQATFQGKDVVYSGDTFFDPPAMKRMNEEGILSDARLDALLRFPWHCDVVLHEAGVAPIHTPLEALASLPEEHKKNVRLIHIDANAAARAAKLGFRIAVPGVENTIVLIPRGEDHQMLKFLQLLGSIEIFRHFAVNQALDLMLMAREEFYPRGALILEKGTVDERFMIILQGRATVEYGDLRKFYRAGDYLGELAAWKQTRIIKQKSHLGFLDRSHGSFLTQASGPQLTHVGRLASRASSSSSSSSSEEGENGDTASELDNGEMVFIDDQIVKETVKAETNVRAMVIDKYALNYLLLNDPILRERLESMIHARMDGSWEAISLNTRLRLLSSMQKTQLQGLLHTKRMRFGDKLWRRGDAVDVAVIVARGTLIFEEVHGKVNKADLSSNTHAPLSPGMLIFDYYGCHHGRPLTTTLVCYSETASIFVIDSLSMLHFLDRNPMILLALLKSPILI